jgi:hypothetical protein
LILDVGWWIAAEPLWRVASEEILDDEFWMVDYEWRLKS